MKKYIVVSVGCLECWLDTYITGIFDDKNIADATAEELNVREINSFGKKEYYTEREHKVFEIEV